VKKAHEAFRLETIENLEQQIDVVFNPEGSSHTTENSPGSFWLGIFKLAASMKEQPYIVPLVMTGFDKLPSEAVYKCQIMPPFKMSEYGIQSSEDPLIKGVIENLNIRYKTWVTELNKKDTHFTSEIKALKKKIRHKHNTKNLVVFYGSSSIRLWKTIENDFKTLNVLNLGFGGAYIESLRHHFESLFTFEAPKAIVLYLGGNDLNLGYSAKKIVALIKKFITVINRKFPNTLIFNISIKPSFERIDKLKTIETINQIMYDLSNEKNFFKHIDFYSAMMKNNTVDGRFLLQDGLHLNSDGYDVLRKLLKKAFKESIL
jgi:lysophospholipase L1-like esterase